MNISLPNGKVVHRSVEEYLFMDDSKVAAWYQGLMAEDAGEYIESPFSTLKDVQTALSLDSDIEDED
jgi:hypothetical protein